MAVNFNKNRRIFFLFFLKISKLDLVVPPCVSGVIMIDVPERFAETRGCRSLKKKEGRGESIFQACSNDSQSTRAEQT